MFRTVSDNSFIQCYDLALLFGVMLTHRCKNAIVGMFGDTWLPVEMPSEDIIANVFAMRELEGRLGYSTNGYEVIYRLIRERKAASFIGEAALRCFVLSR